VSDFACSTKVMLFTVAAPSKLEGNNQDVSQNNLGLSCECVIQIHKNFCGSLSAMAVGYSVGLVTPEY